MAFDERLVARIRVALPDADEKRMFGGVCFLRDGHMVVGVMGDRLLVRVGPATYDAALAEPHARVMDFTRRPMRGFVVIDAEGIASARGLTKWIAWATRQVATLPDKRATRASDKAIAELFADRPAAQRRLLAATRQRVLELVPHAVEKIRPGWGLLGYNAPAYFAFVAPLGDAEVRLGFEWGVMLPDPHRLLVGRGRQLRHVAIASAADLRGRALAELVRTAAGITPPRSTR